MQSPICATEKWVSWCEYSKCQVSPFQGSPRTARWSAGFSEVEINVGIMKMVVGSHRSSMGATVKKLDRPRCGQIESKNYFSRLLLSQDEFCTCRFP